MPPKRVCIKVKELRKRSYNNLKEWMNNTKNMYTGRRGRIFIDKVIYTYKGSKWANPFKVSDKHYDITESLRLYAEYLDDLLRDPTNMKEFIQLNKYEELGCFCSPGDMCHCDVILDRLETLA